MKGLGFGSYRVSVQSDEHREALKRALELGCKYIDTSSNYTNGDSEKLIGEVLKDSTSHAFIFSKVGYIQGDNLALIKEGKFKKDLVVINDSLMHSIHPDFIDDQLERSLERLKLSSLDSYLLHNPEYYLKTDDSSKAEYYSRIEKALLHLESIKQSGVINSYGISSNTFVDPKDDHESTNIEEIVKIINKHDLQGFKYIQFPMNLLELGAFEKQFSGKNLIDYCKQNEIQTVINRPFNAFTDQGFVRLCEYETRDLSEEFAKSEFERLTSTLKNKWNELRDDEADELKDLAIFKQISSIWYKQASTDAIDQIFYGHFFPMLTNIWGEGLTAEESKPFYELYDLSMEFSRFNMTKRALEFKKIAIEKGLISDQGKSLEQLAIEKYEKVGVDIVLCGMKKTIYVDGLKDYF